MTPELKAKELVDKFENQFSYMIEYGDSRQASKQCALILCDEMIEVLPDFDLGIDANACKEYWENVKTEIQKL